MANQIPTLYSFRRCPYAMRARMAIYYSSVPVELREILLKDKPQAMLEASSKGTVPVLVIGDRVIDESRDVLFWALQQSDSDDWFYGLDSELQNRAMSLIDRNDNEFKAWLDRYKYSVGYPEHSQSYYRDKGLEFLGVLEGLLGANPCLLGEKLSAADIAIFPFVRQFAFVDKAWFDQCELNKVRNWLEALLQSELFNAVMDKHAPWQQGDEPLLLRKGSAVNSIKGSVG